MDRAGQRRLRRDRSAGPTRTRVVDGSTAEDSCTTSSAELSADPYELQQNTARGSEFDRRGVTGRDPGRGKTGGTESPQINLSLTFPLDRLSAACPDSVIDRLEENCREKRTREARTRRPAGPGLSAAALRAKWIRKLLEVPVLAGRAAKPRYLVDYAARLFARAICVPLIARTGSVAGSPIQWRYSKDSR